MQSIPNCWSVVTLGDSGVGKRSINNELCGGRIFRDRHQSISTEANLSWYNTFQNTIFYIAPPRNGTGYVAAYSQLDDMLLKTRSSPVRLVFVVILTKGRARRHDAQLVQDVLSAFARPYGGDAAGVKDKFGIIVNKLANPLIHTLNTNSTQASKLHRAMCGRFSTRYWQYLPEDDTFFNTQQTWASSNQRKLSPSPRTFVINLPPITISFGARTQNSFETVARGRKKLTGMEHEQAHEEALKRKSEAVQRYVARLDKEVQTLRDNMETQNRLREGLVQEHQSMEQSMENVLNDLRNMTLGWRAETQKTREKLQSMMHQLG